MRFLEKKKLIVPISLVPGDCVTLSYNKEYTVGNTTVYTDRKEVLRHSVGRNMTINECVVFELEQTELDRYGYKDAIGGLFAEGV